MAAILLSLLLLCIPHEASKMVHKGGQSQQGCGRLFGGIDVILGYRQQIM